MGNRKTSLINTSQINKQRKKEMSFPYQSRRITISVTQNISFFQGMCDKCKHFRKFTHFIEDGDPLGECKKTHVYVYRTNLPSCYGLHYEKKKKANRDQDEDEDEDN